MKTLRSQITTTLIASIVICSAASAQTATPDWYLQQTNVGNNHWNSTNSSASYQFWADGPTVSSYTGKESHYATAMDPNDVYDSNGKDVRTQDISSGTDDFGGGTLILSDGSSLLIKGNKVTHRVEHLQAIGDTTTAVSTDGTVSLSVGLFEQFGTTTLGTSSGSTRNLNLTIDTLTGGASAVMDFSADPTKGGAFNLDIADASGFTGTFKMTYGTFNFLADIELGGALDIATGSVVNLDHSITTSSLTIAGTTLESGTYGYEYLHSTYGSIFSQEGLSGQITVGSVIPESSTFALLAGGLALGVVALRRRRRC